MECPKCGGGAYLAEEEFVKIIENTDPLKVIAKAIYQCRACSDRFTRLSFSDLEAKRRDETIVFPADSQTMDPATTTAEKKAEEEEPEEGLRLF